MYKHILIPTDGSELADKAVGAGLDYALESGAKVTLFTAVPEYRPPSEGEVLARRRGFSIAEHERASQEKAGGILKSGAARASAAGVPFDTDFVQSDQPWKAIIEAAQRHACDAIFMASHGRRGFSKLVHGSQTEQVLTHSKVPTLVYR